MAKLDNKLGINSNSETNWEEITENGEIGYSFIGKSNALRVARKVKPRVLKEILELGINDNKGSKNLVIEGDNLMSMATLYQYHGKIDLILTDPPYNTGEDFRYNDKWDKDPNNPGIGDYVKIDDSSKHTKWLKFMVPRLQLIKRMLKPGGVLAICIDERELSRLLPLLDEQKIMFGEENRIAIINWEKSTPKNDALHVSNTTEYILVYSKKEEIANTERLERPERLDKKYSNPDNDLKGAWVVGDPSAKRDTFSSVYAIQNPFTGKLLLPPSGRSWGWQKSKIKNWLEEYGSEYEEIDLKDDKTPALVLKGVSKFADLTANSITEKASQLAEKRLKKGNWPQLVFSQGGQGRPGIKRYLSEVREGIVPTTYWKWEELGSVSLRSEESGLTTHGTKEIIERVGEKFVGAKPLKLFKKIIQLWCPLGGLVCDPFAGTGTTGEATLYLNQEVKTERERERERESKIDWWGCQVFEQEWIWASIYSNRAGI